MDEATDVGATQKLVSVKLPQPESENLLSEQQTTESALPSVETPAPLFLSDAAPATQAPQKLTKKGKQAPPQPINKRAEAHAEMFRKRCRQFCLTTFFRENSPVGSLGFTSSIDGEGKSFLSAMTAQILAEDSNSPVTLLECNWDRPRLHEYFGFPPTPGFAEWLREECSETAIRHNVSHNLTVIPAGDSKRAPVKLLQKVRQNSFLNTLALANELLIVELPAIITTGYGSLAASLVQSIIIVVRAGVTPDGLIAETCSQLKDLPVDGIFLNQIESKIPQWIRRIIN